MNAKQKRLQKRREQNKERWQGTKAQRKQSQRYAIDQWTVKLKDEGIDLHYTDTSTIHAMFDFEGQRVANYYPSTGSFHRPDHETITLPTIDDAVSLVRQILN